MLEIAPGTILQKMYLKERLKCFRDKDLFFYEIGSGNGNLSKTLLEMGFQGAGFDLNSEACANNKRLNKKYIERGKYEIINKDFFQTDIKDMADLIISSMVIEHFENDLVEKYFERCKSFLRNEGKIITLAPASQKHWGIEDEIAGHYKRYSFNSFIEIAKRHSLQVKDLSGLTFPLSNFLLPLSNLIVYITEKHKKNLTKHNQTIISGNRNVMFKTVYPDFLNLFLNEVTLYPFYVLQKVFKNNPLSLVIYAEFAKV